MLSLKGVAVARVSTVSFFLVSQLKEQVEYLRDLGMKVVLVSSSGPELEQFTFSETYRHEAIAIARNISPFRDLTALVRLFLLFRSERFAIVHSTTPKAGLLTILAGFLARVPVRLHTFTGQPWVTMRQPMRFAARLCDRIIGSISTRCYADSESQRRFLVDEGIVSCGKISVIGNGSLAGVDLRRFSPERYTPEARALLRSELGISANSTVLVFVGRITRDKGIRELVSAFRRIVELGDDVDLLLVGPTDAECGGIDTLDLSGLKSVPRLRSVGYCETPEKYLAIADLLCLPSYREGFGTSVIEAAAMGVPTLGTEIVGLVDAVEHGITGLLVPPQDEESLFNALLYLVKDPQRLKDMGEKARRRCHEKFDSARVSFMVAEEYARLLNGARGMRQ